MLDGSLLFKEHTTQSIPEISKAEGDTAHFQFSGNYLL